MGTDQEHQQGEAPDAMLRLSHVKDGLFDGRKVLVRTSDYGSEEVCSLRVAREYRKTGKTVRNMHGDMIEVQELAPSRFGVTEEELATVLCDYLAAKLARTPQSDESPAA